MPDNKVIKFVCHHWKLKLEWSKIIEMLNISNFYHSTWLNSVQPNIIRTDYGFRSKEDHVLMDNYHNHICLWRASFYLMSKHNNRFGSMISIIRYCFNKITKAPTRILIMESNLEKKRKEWVEFQSKNIMQNQCCLSMIIGQRNQSLWPYSSVALLSLQVEQVSHG